jgi:protein-disulfide isomerase
MNLTKISIAVALLVAACRLQAQHLEPNTTPPTQRETIERIVRNYLLANPAVVREALQAFEAQQAAEAAAKSSRAIQDNQRQLLSESSWATLGNPKGDVTVVAFFDYRCGYCKKLAPELDALVERDPNVRVVLKEFPILGADSISASRAALAARTSGQYLEFHRRLFAAEQVNEDSIAKIAAALRLTAPAAPGDEAPARIIESNHELGNRLGVSGTPALVIGERLLPGAANVETLLMMVEAERAKRIDQAAAIPAEKR